VRLRRAPFQAFDRDRPAFGVRLFHFRAWSRRVASHMASSLLGDTPLPRWAPFLSTNNQPYSSGPKYVLPLNHGPPAGVRSIRDPLSSSSVSVIVTAPCGPAGPLYESWQSLARNHVKIFAGLSGPQSQRTIGRTHRCREDHRRLASFGHTTHEPASRDQRPDIQLFPCRFHRLRGNRALRCASRWL